MVASTAKDYYSQLFEYKRYVKQIYLTLQAVIDSKVFNIENQRLSSGKRCLRSQSVTYASMQTCNFDIGLRLFVNLSQLE